MQPAQRQTDREAEQRRDAEDGGIFPANERDDEGNEQGHALDAQDDAENFENELFVHVAPSSVQRLNGPECR